MNVPVVRFIPAAQTHALRAEVLRPGLPLETAIYAGDEAALHFGAFLEENLVGVASLYEETQPETTEAALRLRGMAVSPQAQSAGIGRALTGACLDEAKKRQIPRIWCNARRSAVGFYQKSGFQIAGEEFEIEGVGPHFVMWRAI